MEAYVIHLKDSEPAHLPLCSFEEGEAKYSFYLPGQKEPFAVFEKSFVLDIKAEEQAPGDFLYG